MPVAKSAFGPLYSPAAAALCLLTSRRRFSRLANELGGLDAVINVLRPSTDPYTLEATCALLVNLVHAAPEVASLAAGAAAGGASGDPGAAEWAEGADGGEPKVVVCMQKILDAMETYPGHAPLQQCACQALAALAAPGAGGASLVEAAEAAGAVDLVADALERHPNHEGLLEDAMACFLRFATPMNSVRKLLLQYGLLNCITDGVVDRFPKNAELMARAPTRPEHHLIHVAFRTAALCSPVPARSHTAERGVRSSALPHARSQQRSWWLC